MRRFEIVVLFLALFFCRSLANQSTSIVVMIRKKIVFLKAAFLNGMALRYFDYNDYVALGRPSHASINVAAALAVVSVFAGACSINSSSQSVGSTSATTTTTGTITRFLKTPLITVVTPL